MSAIWTTLDGNDTNFRNNILLTPISLPICACFQTYSRRRRLYVIQLCLDQTNVFTYIGIVVDFIKCYLVAFHINTIVDRP